MPAAQFVHWAAEFAPETRLWVPAGHGTHDELLVCLPWVLYVPAGHGVHPEILEISVEGL